MHNAPMPLRPPFEAQDLLGRQLYIQTISVVHGFHRTWIGLHFSYASAVLLGHRWCFLNRSCSI